METKTNTKCTRCRKQKKLTSGNLYCAKCFKVLEEKVKNAKSFKLTMTHITKDITKGNKTMKTYTNSSLVFSTFEINCKTLNGKNAKLSIVKYSKGMPVLDLYLDGKHEGDFIGANFKDCYKRAISLFNAIKA